MKKITWPSWLRLPKRNSFAAKFGRDTEFFGSREKRKKRRVLPVILILLGMLGGIFLSITIMGAGSFWRVKDVTAQDGSIYTGAVLVEYSGVRAGDGMLGFDTFVVARQLKKDLPLLDKVKVRKKLNGTVTISVTEQTDLYYTRHNQNYYIISSNTHEVL